MKVNTLIIPDVHGRQFWRKAIEDYDAEKIVFLGDYLDMYEYEGINEKDQWQGFQDILQLKKESPEKVILLLGNHDCQYFLPMESSSRYNRWMAGEYESAFMKNLSDFNIYYKKDYEEKHILFSHAGILPPWVSKYEFDGIQTPEEVCWTNLPDLDHLLLFDRDKLGKAMDDVSCWRWGPDYCGSIVWADVHEHINFSVPDFIQVFSHTQQEKWPINIENRAYCLDCRRAFFVDDSGNIFDTETNEVIPVTDIKNIY